MCNITTEDLHMDHPMSSQYSEKIVGFDARNKNSISSNYICPICKLVFRNPVQLHCGHRVCQSCVNIDEHFTVKCIKCNAETSQDEILVDRGCQYDMETLEILCSYCDWHDIFKNYQEHILTNHTSLSCKYCEKKFDTINLLKQHQLECEKMLVNCQLKQYGCNEQFLPESIEKHLLTEKHRSIMLNLLFQTTPHLMNNNEDQQLKYSQMDIDLPQTTISNNKLNETINVLLNSIHVLNDDVQQLSSESLHSQCSLQSMSEDLSKLKISIQETNISAEGLKPNQQILLQDVESLKQDIEDQQAASYDGTLVWRITDFQKKMADAQSGKQTSIYSPPFYSSPNGYKMCVRLYLYGDGKARRTHMSIFFVLMRGEHDAILQFPFHFKVTFCLFDQTNQQRHVFDSFRPDIKSNSFQRPDSKMNIASGIPKFFPLQIIQHSNNPYVRNDTMFIKVMVDFNNTPKTLLPYILHINPGLSETIQQVMIKREMDKQAQQQLIDTDTTITPVMTTDSK